MNKKNLFFVFFLLFSLCFSSVTFGVTTYPYSEVLLYLTPLDEPQFGLGGLSSFASGIHDCLVNPAGLGRMATFETVISVLQRSLAYSSNKNYQIDDQTIASFGGISGYSANIFFTSSNSNDLTVKKRDYAGKVTYQTVDTGVSFKQSMRVLDWLAVGFVTRGDTQGNLNLAGDTPFTAQSKLEMKGTANFQGTGISINNSGKITYVNGGVTYTSSKSLWDPFLTQVTTIPATLKTELKNNLVVKSNVTFSSAINKDNFMFGLNLTPISANAEINNSAYAIIDANTPDGTLYVPNFDPASPASISQWVVDENYYAGSNGYRKRYITLPSGEKLLDTQYKGFFSASTLRMDLGFLWDISDFFAVSAAYENFGGAQLDFKGSGISTYAQSRVPVTETDSIIDPSLTTAWRPFTDSYAPISGTENWYLNSSHAFNLPKKMRLGFALKKPFLFGLDIEQQQNPIYIKLKYADTQNNIDYDIKINNLMVYKIGWESQMFALPLWLRLETSLLPKPDIIGLNAAQQKSLDDAYSKLPVMPASFDLGMRTNIFSWITGFDVGFNALSLLSVVQLDVLNNDASKPLYVDFYVRKDNWQVTYLAGADIGSTIGAYQNRTVAAGEKKSFAWSDVKLLSTLAVSYRF